MAIYPYDDEISEIVSPFHLQMDKATEKTMKENYPFVMKKLMDYGVVA